MEVYFASTANGAQIVIHDCNGGEETLERVQCLGLEFTQIEGARKWG
jgi:hypothetical protein